MAADVSVGLLAIYPIKSLDPLFVSEAPIGPTGALAGDRVAALFDTAGKVFNAKRSALLHTIRSTYAPDLSTVTLTEPGKTETTFLFQEGPELNNWFSRVLGLPLNLVFSADRPFPDDTEFPGPTIIARSSLETVASWYDFDLEECRRRFRTNIELTGSPAFFEDGLAANGGYDFLLGDIQFSGMNLSARCVVPSRESQQGTLTPNFSRTFVEQRKKEAPAHLDHFYRLALNTRVSAGSTGKVLRTGDPFAELWNFNW